MKKLLSAIEYWEHLIIIREPSHWVTVRTFDEYIQFLKQPLQLGFFVPCDNEGKPLEKPDRYDNWLKNQGSWMGADLECIEYQQACDRKIFTGFELYQDTYFNSYNCVIRGSDMVIINIENKTIEDIAPLKVEVTDRIAKQLNIRL